MNKIYIDLLSDSRSNAEPVDCSWGTKYFPSATRSATQIEHQELYDITYSLCFGAMHRTVSTNNVWFNRLEEVARIITRGSDVSLQCGCYSELTGKVHHKPCHCEPIKEAVTSIAKSLVSRIKSEDLPKIDPITKLIVAGGRDFKNIDLLGNVVADCVYKGYISDTATLICGEAKGADSTAKVFWLDAGLPIESYPAKWDDLVTEPVSIVTRPNGTQYNKLAGFNRNKLMGQNANGLLAFWDGVSSGTHDMIMQSIKLGIPVFVCLYHCGFNQKTVQLKLLDEIDNNPETEGAYIQFVF